MTAPHEWFPFHEDEAVAAAVGAVLTGDPSIEEVATRYGVDSDSVVDGVVALGLTEHVAADTVGHK